MLILNDDQRRTKFQKGGLLGTMGFVKEWRGGHVLYYRYAPPETKPGEFRDETLPEKPYPGCEPFERSVFYYWWEFLRENDAYMATCANGGFGEMAQLYEAFGDVRGDDFLEWWRSPGCRLFCEPLERLVRVHDVDPSGRVAITNAADQMVVTFPTDGDIKRILAEVKVRVQRAQQQFQQLGDFSSARFPVERNPVLSALHKRLRVWQIRKQNPDLPFHRVAQEAGLKFSYDADNPTQRGIVALRYHKEASFLVEYVGKGRFPVYNAAQAAKQPTRPVKAKPFSRAYS